MVNWHVAQDEAGVGGGDIGNVIEDLNKGVDSVKGQWSDLEAMEATWLGIQWIIG